MVLCRLSVHAKNYSFLTRTAIAHNYAPVLRPLSTLAMNKDLKMIDELPGHPSYLGFGLVFRVAMAKLFVKKPFGKLALDAQFEDVKRFGNIFKAEFPGIKMVTLSDPVDVAKVLRNEPKYPNRMDFPLIDYYRKQRKAVPGVFFANGKDWYRYRSTVSKRILKPREVIEYVLTFNEIIDDLIARLDTIRMPSGSDTEYEVKGLDNELFKWSFESVAHVLFDRRFGCIGDNVNPEAQDFIKSVGGFLETIISAGMVPLSLYKIYKPKVLKDCFYHFDTMYKYAGLFISKKVQELEKEGKLDPKYTEQQTEDPEKVGFIEFLLTKEGLTEDDLMASIIDLLFAGVDTTSNTMQWFLYMMAKNQDKQEKLYQEISQVHEANELPSPKTLSKMPYLKACFKETLRLFPLLSALSRRIPVDMEIQGYYLPKGTNVQMLTYYMSRNESNFTEADKFVPERWLRNKKKELNDINAFSSIPFGFGTRMCAGRRIAELELYMLATRLVKKYNIKYPVNEIVEPFMRGVTIPDRPLRVKFIDRM